MSQESGLDEASTGSYVLFAVANHYGNLVGGHYTVVCRAPPADGVLDKADTPAVRDAGRRGARGEDGKDALCKDPWFSCSDEVVTRLPAASVASPCAYILCYHRKA